MNIYSSGIFTLFWKDHQINAVPYSCYIQSFLAGVILWLILPVQCTGLGVFCWPGISQFLGSSPSFPSFQWMPITMQCVLNVKKFYVVFLHIFAFEPSLFCWGVFLSFFTTFSQKFSFSLCRPFVCIFFFF